MTSVLTLLLLLIPVLTWATPLQGFHEGPYLQVTAGARDAAFDTNVADNTTNGRDIEAAYGFLFGWNLIDPVSIEMQGAYSSAGKGALQQHLIDVRFSGRYSLITNTFTDFHSLRLLPFVDAGLKMQLNILPNATAAADDRVLQWGVGPSVGGGLSALFFRDSVYVSLRGGVDVVHRAQINQDIGGVATVVYPGGWGVDWSATSAVGVHF